MAVVSNHQWVKEMAEQAKQGQVANGYGWLVEFENKIDTANHYSLQTVVSGLVPENIENQAKNIRIERVIFAEDDNSPTYRKAMRLVPEEKWKVMRGRYRQPPYLIMLFRIEDNHEEEIQSLLNQDLFLKESVDLREYFSPVSKQKGMTCNAHAGKALMEYFQNRTSHRINNNLSWRFLYKVTRDLMDLEGSLIKDGLKRGGATLKDTLKAMVLFGIPPEKSDKNWIPKNNQNKIDDDQWLKEEESRNPDAKAPSAFAFAYAQNFQASNYFRLDKLRQNYNRGFLTLDKKKKHDIEVGQLTVAQIRIALASGFPAIFGISDVSFIKDFIKQEDLNENSQRAKPDNIKLGQVKITKEMHGKLSEFTSYKSYKDTNSDTIGHALVAVGYDDYLEFYLESDRIKQDNSNSDINRKPLFTGGFLFRDSQGEDWGDKGYGWFPYEYVEKDLATDWWSLLNAEWINTGGFGIDTDQLLGCGTNDCGGTNEC